LVDGPALLGHFGALRQRKPSALFDVGDAGCNAPALGIHDCKHIRCIPEWNEPPDLIFAAIAFVDDDWVAGTWGRVRLASQAFETKTPGNQGPAAFVAKDLIRLSVAGSSRQAFAGFVFRIWHLDAPVGVSGRMHWSKGVKIFGSVHRIANKDRYSKGEYYGNAAPDIRRLLLV
jgi:hypothetical protein